jgi:hypothetical protein
MTIASTDVAGARVKEVEHWSVYTNDKLSLVIVCAPFVHYKQ